MAGFEDSQMADDNDHTGMSTNSVELKLKDNKTHICQVHFYERCSFTFCKVAEWWDWCTCGLEYPREPPFKSAFSLLKCSTLPFYIGDG